MGDRVGVELLYNAVKTEVETVGSGSWQFSSAGAVASPNSSRVAASWRRDVVGKTTSGRRGLLALMSWGPEKMLIRCSKESQHPTEWTPGLRLSLKRTRKTKRDGHNNGGQNIEVYVRSPAPSHSRTPHNPFEPLQIKWEVNIVKEVFLRLYYCVVVML